MNRYVHEIRMTKYGFLEQYEGRIQYDDFSGFEFTIRISNGLAEMFFGSSFVLMRIYKNKSKQFFYNSELISLFKEFNTLLLPHQINRAKDKFLSQFEK